MSGRGQVIVTSHRALVRMTNGSSKVLRKGDPLPGDLADGEAKRLARQGHLGRVKPAAAPEADATPEAPETPTEGEQGASGDATSTEEGDGGSADELLDEFDPLKLDVPALAQHIETAKEGKPLNATEVVALAKHDDPQVAGERAAHLVAAEQHARGGDGRGTVLGPLAKLVEAGKAAGE